MPGRLGLIAGGGDLPVRLLDACRASGREVFVVALEGQAAPALVGSDTPHAWARIGAAGRIVDLLREAGVEELIMAGKVVRPSLAALRPDWRALKFLAARGGRLGGDDDILSAVIQAIEREEGIRVVSPAAVLGDLAAPRGPLGRCRPGAEDDADIVLGLAAARQLGALDVGQAVVVQHGLVLGVEAGEGTDQLLARCAGLRRDGPGGVLVKLKKPRQERRADLPTIGPATVHAAADAGLEGIAVHAGNCMIIEQQAVIAAADHAGLFVLGVDGRE
jgi:hypothetical protein